MLCLWKNVQKFLHTNIITFRWINSCNDHLHLPQAFSQRLAIFQLRLQYGFNRLHLRSFILFPQQPWGFVWPQVALHLFWTQSFLHFPLRHFPLQSRRANLFLHESITIRYKFVFILSYHPTFIKRLSSVILLTWHVRFFGWCIGWFYNRGIRLCFCV